jgi:23S rRNA (adenine-N6)-dimethyltransferase
VLDIGAGTGGITRQLLGIGATVVAVELHPVRAEILRARFTGDRCTVLQVDATRMRLPARPFRVVANPPWAVSVTVLRRLTAPRSRLIRGDLVVPAHVAGRWRAGRMPDARRVLTRFDVRVERWFSPDAFTPAATGPAAVLVIERLRTDRPTSPASTSGAGRSCPPSP